MRDESASFAFMLLIPPIATAGIFNILFNEYSLSLAKYPEIIKKAALLYVAILRTAQQLNQQDLEGQNGKTNLAKAIVKDVNAILEYGDVSAVTFSQFLVYKKPVVKSHEF